MHLGIDLGTSNSAIVGNFQSDLRLFKTAEGTDILPSVIYVDKRGHKFIGNRAYQQALLSPENVAQGFKRLMGTSSPMSFGDSSSAMSPEECSAEIIRTLLGQSRTEAGDVGIEGAVVTIPAAFNQMQSEATIRAAHMGGLNRVGLLQEPIAAAMASISQSKSKNAQFLVYDLGGGTFDVALVQSIGGSVNIVAHEGINMLGGRDFDRMIVDSIVRPWLKANFALPENFQAEARYRRLAGIARFATEKAKIELSSSAVALIFAGDEEVRVQDETGKDIYLSIDITREEVERVIKDRIEESVLLCRKVLKDNGFSHEDVDRVVFIGGPSKMPWIRARVPQELGIPADLQTDPMTAVAFGAAIFAESREWGDKATTKKSSRASAVVHSKVDIRYDFPARTSDDRVKIRIRPSVPAEGYTLQIDASDGWSSGLAKVAPDLSMEVPLANRGENQFRIVVFDPSGSPLPEATTILTVMRTHASAAGIPATHNIAVKVIDKTSGSDRNTLDVLVTKGTMLPAQGTKTFRAARDLHAGEPGHIDLELYQQAEGVREPELNLFVGSFRIDAQNLLHNGDLLRKGDEIVVHWQMDDNGLLNCTLEITALGQSFDTGKFYADTAGHQNFEGADGEALTTAVLAGAEKEISEAEAAIGAVAGAEVEKLKRRMKQQRNTLAQGADADTRRSATEEARTVRQAVSRLRHAPEHRGPLLRRELSEIQGAFDQTIRDHADARFVEIFDRLAGTVRSAIRNNDFDGAERAIGEMKGILFRELWRQPSYLLHVFKTICSERYLAADKGLHDECVGEGEQAIAANDVDTLRQVLRQMFENRFSVGGGDQAVAVLAGLMRG